MRRAPFLSLVFLLGGTACHDDQTGPSSESPPAQAVTTTTTATPHFLRAASNAPTIANPVITFTAKKGERRTVFMMYHAKPGQKDSTDLIRFRLRENSLLRRPDGSLIKNGESVKITLKLVDPVKLIVSFEPTGLRFNPQDPADLRIRWNETNPDVNRDGTVNQEDATLKQRFKIWRRESSTQPWIRTTSVVNVPSQDCELDVTGFTRYAVAY